MIPSYRWLAVLVAGLAIAVAVGCGAGAGKAESKTAVTPCGRATSPAWSPDGTQIGWYGFRWPLPAHHHRVGTYNILRAICVSDADGKRVRPLANTACSEHCSVGFADPVDQLDWVGTSQLVYGNDNGASTISVGQKPKLVGRKGPEPYSVDAGGDRIAISAVAFGCTDCSGPVKILSVPSGAVVGVVGGTKLDNSQPSLSPDGTQVVFTRSAGKASGPAPSIWTAAADGSHLQRLERNADSPLWSPAGNRIAYLAPGPVRSAWRVVAAQGGASTTLLRNGPGTVFGWSPDGRHIAFPDSKGRLAVIDVATRKVRTLLKLQLPYASSSVAWSPNSRQLLVVWRAPAHSGCPSGLWRVPINGAKPHLVHGC